VNNKLPRINKIIFKLFLLMIFFVYYETILIPGTLHTWLIFFGLIFTIPIINKKYSGSEIKLPLDYILILILVLVIVLGFLVNYSTTDWINFQAYILMLATYIYVKENTTDDTLAFLYSIIKYFILIHGLLVMLQLFTGSYFPARFLAAGEPALTIATGVFDGPTKNGMITSFALSFMFAKFILKNYSFSLFDTLIFFIGIIALLASAQRAGTISFGVVVIFVSIFMLLQSIRKKRYASVLSSIAIVIITTFSAVTLITQYGLDFQSLYDILYYLRDPDANIYGLDVVIYKLSVFNDDSALARFNTIEYGLKKFVDSPLPFFSVGFGTGTFEKIYGINVHNSYFELLFTTGFLGFFVFLFLVVHVVLKALSRPNVLEIIPVLFALGSFMVFMLVHDVLRGRMFWIALGITSAFAYSNLGRKKEVS
jgi:hypothetical protein